MHRRKLTVLALAAVAVAAVGLTGASAGTGPHGRFQMVAGGTISSSSSRYIPLALSNKMVSYILEMAARPVAVVDVASKASGRGPLSSAQKATLTRQLSMRQAPVVAAVQQLHGATVTSRFQGVYNGIAVALPQREAWKLASIPGVKAVFATKTYKMDVAPGNGIPLVNAPQTWGGIGAYTGTGMKIADIDTGIDYTHADFGGTGTTAAFSCAAAHSTDDAATFAIDCPGVSNWYSGTKVKGGIDLVGDSYNANPSSAAYQPVPHPDSNPLDCNGHGSHTAGTAAGYGVDGSGATYTGAYNANTINNNSFIIPPGVAPQASLYAVRVFGCGGSVNDSVLIDAMNWAFNNGMDVVNMSLGATFGSPTDPDSVAANNLANDGVITVLSSGNSGPNPYMTGSPAAGVAALAVAANDSTPSFPAATLTLTKADLTAGGSMTAIDANGVNIPAGPFTIRVIHTDGGAFNAAVISRGCSVVDDMAQNGGVPWPAGTVLVVRRGTCARVAKAIYARDAGAAAVVMVNNSTSLPPYEGPITSNPDTGASVAAVTIPFLGVTGGSNPSTSANGVALMAADAGSMALASTSLANPTYKGLASFTSFGPSAGGNAKPEVTAPGVSIISAGVGSGNGGVFLSGTSMAAPHTTGEAALVKQAHPSWGAVAFWKDAIVNTANPLNVSNYSVRGAGAGEIDAYNATHTNCVAGGSTGTTALSFGVPESNAHYTGNATITLNNFSGSACDFQMSVTRKSGVNHSVRVFSGNSFSPLKIRVPAHGTATISVQLDVLKSDAAGSVKRFNDCWNNASCQFDDAGGLIHFRALNGTNHGIGLNVPYYAVPTLVSNVKVDGITSAALAGGATDGNVVLRNPDGGIGYADFFSWGGSSPVSGTDIGSADLLNDGVQSFPDGSNTADASSLVVFALQTSKAWTNPAENVAEIDIDVNNDGVPDYALLSYDLGGWTAGSVNGEAVVVAYNLHTGANAIHYLTKAMFNGTTMELPARFSDLCTAGAPCVTAGVPIHYSTFMNDRNGGSDSITTNASFDIFHPSLSTVNGSSDTIHRNSVVSDPVTIDPSAWTANPQLGIMVLMQNNGGSFPTEMFSLSF